MAARRHHHDVERTALGRIAQAHAARLVLGVAETLERELVDVLAVLHLVGECDVAVEHVLDERRAGEHAATAFKVAHFGEALEMRLAAGLARHHVEDAADGVAPIERALRAVQQLDVIETERQ